MKIDTYEDGLPISVIIPFQFKRDRFYNRFVFPSIEGNMPKEIIRVNGKGSAPEKRNKGFKASTQPYVFFCDDDIILPDGYFQKLYDVLSKTGMYVGYAYTGYKGIVLNDNHPIGKNYEIKSQEWDMNDLIRFNYISTMSLIKREHFKGFDERLPRFQDWDLWLTLAEEMVSGVFIPNYYFLAFYNDDGITSKNNNERLAMDKLKAKHPILNPFL